MILPGSGRPEDRNPGWVEAQSEMKRLGHIIVILPGAPPDPVRKPYLQVAVQRIHVTYDIIGLQTGLKQATCRPVAAHADVGRTQHFKACAGRGEIPVCKYCQVRSHHSK